MTMDNKEERRKALREEFDIPSAIAAAASYEGLPILTRPILEKLPMGIAEGLMSGQKITAEAGTPLSRIAEFTRGEVRAIENFARESGVKVPIVSLPTVRAGGAFIDPTTPIGKGREAISRLMEGKRLGGAPFIGMSTSSVPHTMHEIGHARPIMGSTALRKIMHDASSSLGLKGGAGILARMGLAANVLAPPGEDSGRAREFLYNNAPALVGATMLPELVEEGRASIHAIRGAKKYGPGTLKAIKELAPAFGTYAAAAVAPILATMIAKNLVKAMNRRAEGEEKTGAAAAGTEVKASGRLRSSASASRWLGTPYAKPKTTKPNQNPAARADETPKANPVSNTAYLKDTVQSMNDPQRGFRIAVQG